MKHQYFGDINDYRKYGLIKALSGAGRLPTCICWMLTPDSEGSKDGRKISYLSHPKTWRHFDPEIFDFLQEEMLQRETGRVIAEGALARVLPGVSFYAPFLQDASTDRAEYFKTLAHKLPPTGGLVFFDPDNGLEVMSCPKGRKNSSKYLYWDEATAAYEAGQSVLIYQHFQRIKRKQFIRTISDKAAAVTGATVFAYVTSHVVFFLLARPEHLDHFQKANAVLTRQWGSQILVFSGGVGLQLGTEPFCPFCTLGQPPIIASNPHAIAIYDNYPVSPGHCLIIPRRHMASLFDAKAEERAALLDLLAEMRQFLQDERHPDGFNIGINDGPAAGQTIRHLHIHLIPRYMGDAADPRGGVRWISPEKAVYWKMP